MINQKHDLTTTLNERYQAKSTSTPSERQLVKEMVNELKELDVFKGMTDKSLKKLVKRKINKLKKDYTHAKD